MIGNILEEAGWRQGSVVKVADTEPLLCAIGRDSDESFVLIVASQSCDIANNSLETEPNIELSIGRQIESLNGMLTHNKNPRTLHTTIACRTEDSNVNREVHLELKAFEKVAIPKETFENLTPDATKVLELQKIESYRSWLAARYSRPAHPSSFNSALSTVDPRSKLKRKAKKGNEQLTGIYIQLTPDAELKDDENYNVNLLGLLPAGFSGDSSNAKDAVDAYASALRQAGMTVTAALRKEDEVSLALIRGFKRLYLDDLSFQEGTQHPVETHTIT